MGRCPRKRPHTQPLNRRPTGGGRSASRSGTTPVHRSPAVSEHRGGTPRACRPPCEVGQPGRWPRTCQQLVQSLAHFVSGRCCEDWIQGVGDSHKLGVRWAASEWGGRHVVGEDACDPRKGVLDLAGDPTGDAAPTVDECDDEAYRKCVRICRGRLGGGVHGSSVTR